MTERTTDQTVVGIFAEHSSRIERLESELVALMDANRRNQALFSEEVRAERAEERRSREKFDAREDEKIVMAREDNQRLRALLTQNERMMLAWELIAGRLGRMLEVVEEAVESGWGPG